MYRVKQFCSSLDFSQQFVFSLSGATSLFRLAAPAVYLATFAVELLFLDRPAVGNFTLDRGSPEEAPRSGGERVEEPLAKPSARKSAKARTKEKYNRRFFRYQSTALVPVVEEPEEEA